MQFVQRCDAFVILVVDICSSTEEFAYDILMTGTSYSVISESTSRHRETA